MRSADHRVAQELRPEYAKGDVIETLTVEHNDDGASAAGSFKIATSGNEQQVSAALSALTTKVSSSLEWLGGQLGALQKTCVSQISAVEADLNGIKAAQERLASELSNQMAKLDHLLEVLTQQKNAV